LTPGASANATGESRDQPTGSSKLSLAITSPEDNAVFAVYPPGGPPLLTVATDSQLVLPVGGDHQLVVGSVRGNVGYDLDISIAD